MLVNPLKGGLCGTRVLAPRVFDLGFWFMVSKSHRRINRGP
jgi:hypothetical protein